MQEAFKDSPWSSSGVSQELGVIDDHSVEQTADQASFTDINGYKYEIDGLVSDPQVPVILVKLGKFGEMVKWRHLLYIHVHCECWALASTPSEQYPAPQNC